MRRLLGTALLALAFGAVTALPAFAQYPPNPGADGAATGINTAQPWVVSNGNPVVVTAENHGNAAATVSVSPAVTAGASATVVPSSQDFAMNPGDVVNAQFTVTPSATGSNTLQACAAATSPLDVHGADNCVNANVNTSPASAQSKPAVSRQNGGTLAFFLKNTLPASNTLNFADFNFFYGSSVGDIPIFGDWTGKGYKSVGIYRGNDDGGGNGAFYLRNSNSTGVADIAFRFGINGDIPIVGDWTATGIDRIGLYRPSTAQWFILNTLASGPPNNFFVFGNAQCGTNVSSPTCGDTSVVGNWTGTTSAPKQQIGIVRCSTSTASACGPRGTGDKWFIKFNSFPPNGGGAVADTSFNFGNPTDIPIVGEWTGQGSGLPGIVRAGRWFLRNTFTPGNADRQFGFGNNVNCTGGVPAAGCDVPLVWK